MVYNTTLLENTTNFGSAFIELNTLTNDLLISFILFSLFFIFLIVLSNSGLKISMIVSAFVTTSASLLLFAGGFVGINVVIVPLVLLVGSVIYFTFTQN